LSDVRISDTLAMTRNLDELRHLDQQERILAERMAAQAAERALQEEKKDVEEADRSVADRNEDAGGRGEYHAHRREKEEKKPAPPEISEGHILDLKA